MQSRASDSLCWVESVVLDAVSGKELAVCPFIKKVLFSRSGFPRSYNFWNLCSLDEGHCDFHGCRLKFSSYGIDSLRVVWVCPKIVDLSLLRRSGGRVCE